MNKVHDGVTLQLGAESSATENVAGWQAEVFALSNAARGDLLSQQTITLEKDAVSSNSNCKTAPGCWLRPKTWDAIWGRRSAAARASPA